MITEAWQVEEVAKCLESPHYFLTTYCRIQDNITRQWIPFELWPAQERALDDLHHHQFVAWLKARQVGASWMVCAYAVWEGTFRSNSNILIFSRRQDEAIHLLYDRIRGIYSHLPEWMRAPFMQESKTILQLANTSTFRVLTESGADTYSGNLVIIDESALVDNFHNILASAEPTIIKGGKLVALGRANKKRPAHPFHELFKAAQKGENKYKPIFIAWHDRPDRTQEWYNSLKISDDERFEMYPATPAEALSAGYAGLIYPTWDSGQNVTTRAEYDPQHEVYWTIDPAYYPDLFVVQLVQVRPIDGVERVAVFDEYVTQQEISSAVITKVLSKGYAAPDYIYTPHDANEFRGVAHNMGYQCIKVKAGAGSVEDGIRIVRRFVLNHDDMRLLYVHPRCTATISAFEQYRYDEKLGEVAHGQLKPLHDEHSHPMDAIRYFFMGAYRSVMIEEEF